MAPVQWIQLLAMPPIGGYGAACDRVAEGAEGLRQVLPCRVLLLPRSSWAKLDVSSQRLLDKIPSDGGIMAGGHVASHSLSQRTAIKARGLT